MVGTYSDLRQDMQDKLHDDRAVLLPNTLEGLSRKEDSRRSDKAVQLLSNERQATDHG
jgi:hypothetical protein